MQHRWLPALVYAGLMAAPAAAHEYWIAANDFMPAPGEPVALTLNVGDMMRGTELPWLDHQVSRFDIVAGETVAAYRGLAGDVPAASITAEPGLTIVAHTTTALPITFGTLAEFREYLDYEGLGGTAELHAARGWPETGITEHYARSAKTLIQTGPISPGDADRVTGLPYEFVAAANPYSAPAVLPLTLLWQGKPAQAAPVAVFEEKDGPVSRTLTKTDGDGRIDLIPTPGATYLVNAVHIEPVDDADHLWESTWASLMFRVPKMPKE